MPASTIEALSTEYAQLTQPALENLPYCEEGLPLDGWPFFAGKALVLASKNPIQWKLKRAVDFGLSLFGLVCLLPVFFVVAVAIWLESPGPIIYKQQRIGFKQKPFKIYKFRSMYRDADSRLNDLISLNEGNQVMFKLFNDPRVTRVGAFIRKYSIDELPQLINVLKGEMSLVGPRPPVRREVALYKNWHFVRFNTLPGLTGLWQVSGRSKIKDFDQVVKLDWDYIRNWNFWLDLKLLLKTIPVVLGGLDTA